MSNAASSQDPPVPLDAARLRELETRHVDQNDLLGQPDAMDLYLALCNAAYMRLLADAPSLEDHESSWLMGARDTIESLVGKLLATRASLAKAGSEHAALLSRLAQSETRAAAWEQRAKYEEAAASDLLDERDTRVDQIERAYAALGGENEWSNMHDLGEESVELAEAIVAERDALIAQPEGEAKPKKGLRAAVRRFLTAWDDEADDPAGVNFAIGRLRALVDSSRASTPTTEPTDASAEGSHRLDCRKPLAYTSRFCTYCGAENLAIPATPTSGTEGGQSHG